MIYACVGTIYHYSSISRLLCTHLHRGQQRRLIDVCKHTRISSLCFFSYGCADTNQSGMGHVYRWTAFLLCHIGRKEVSGFSYMYIQGIDKINYPPYRFIPCTNLEHYRFAVPTILQHEAYRTMEVLLYKNVACIFLMFTNKLDKHYHLSTHICKQTTVHVTKTAEHKMDTIGGGVQVQRLLK